MGDFFQNGPLTTLHGFGTLDKLALEDLLEGMVDRDTNDSPPHKIGVALPLTASHMRATAFQRIIDELSMANYVDTVAVSLNVAANLADYREAVQAIRPLGDKAKVIWNDGKRIQGLYAKLQQSGLNLNTPGKGRAIWTAFGYLLAHPQLNVFLVHDCDIVEYDREILGRLCLPMIAPGLDFEFCKAFYARVNGRMYGRCGRLWLGPLLNTLTATIGHDSFLSFLGGFRYPLSGEFAITSSLARSNRIPGDWGLEIGTLAEVFRNTSVKRVCQVDLCRSYEHQHQEFLPQDTDQGLIRMAKDILVCIFRTLASRGVTLRRDDLVTLRSAYMRSAQDAIRQFHADALINGLEFDRHAEEQMIEAFAEQVTAAGVLFRDEPSGGEAIPNWARVLSAFPDFPRALRDAVEGDNREYGSCRTGSSASIRETPPLC